MLLWCSVNTQSFVNDQSSSALPLIKGKSSDLQKLLTCFSGIMTSTFKVIVSGCACWSASPLFAACNSLVSVFSVISVVYLNDLLSEALWLTLSSSFL